MSTTECPDCGKFYVGTRCACGFHMPKPSGTPRYQTPPWMLEPPPCSEEENFRALQLVRAVTEHLITIHHAHLGLHALVHGRELEDGISTCACGLEFAP